MLTLSHLPSVLLPTVTTGSENTSSATTTATAARCLTEQHEQPTSQSVSSPTVVSVPNKANRRKGAFRSLTSQLKSLGRGDISKEDKHKILSANGGDVDSAVQSLTQSSQPLITDNTKWTYAVSSNKSAFEKQWRGKNGELNFVSGVPSEDGVNVSLDSIKGESVV